MTKMRAVFKKEKKPGLVVDSAEMPTPSQEKPEAVLKVLCTTICGSDLHLWRWDEWAQKMLTPPRVIGHEVAGVVVEVSRGVNSVKPGDFVSAETHLWDGTCPACRRGQFHLCHHLRILGFDVDGSFAEFVKVPVQNLWKNDPNLKPEIASLQEPMGNAVYSALITNLTARNVSIFGAGPIGLMCCAVARAAGANRIFLVEPIAYRLSFGEKMGATDLINPAVTNPVEYIMDHTGGTGVDVFLEMSGAESAYRDGFKSLRRGGVASLLGIAPRDVIIDINNAIVLRGASVYGIHGRLIYETWEEVSRLLSSGKVNLEPLITHRFRLEDINEAMQLLHTQSAMKIVLTP
ncbi:MAG: zinc-binding dehydrogenase [bacterium JZ-2024 1]